MPNNVNGRRSLETYYNTRILFLLPDRETCRLERHKVSGVPFKRIYKNTYYYYFNNYNKCVQTKTYCIGKNKIIYLLFLYIII